MESLPLKIRAFPFNYRKIMEHKKIDFQWLVEGLDRQGRVEMLDMLGTSLSIELSENIFVHLKTAHGMYSSERASTFVAQERTHSAYHKIFNSKLISPNYEKNEYVGQIHAATHPVFKVHREPWLLQLQQNPQDLRLKKAALRRGAVFEAIVGFVSARVLFEELEQTSLDAMARLSPSHYLWYYHLTEEAEHLEEAFTDFEETFQEEVFCPKNFFDCLRDLEDGVRQTLHCTFNAAQILGEPVTVKELSELPRKKRIAEITKQYLVPGFHPKAFREERAGYVQKWENVIEPALRKHVETLYVSGSTDKKVA